MDRSANRCLCVQVGTLGRPVRCVPSVFLSVAPPALGLVVVGLARLAWWVPAAASARLPAPTLPPRLFTACPRVRANSTRQNLLAVSRKGRRQRAPRTAPDGRGQTRTKRGASAAPDYDYHELGRRRRGPPRSGSGAVRGAVRPGAPPVGGGLHDEPDLQGRHAPTAHRETRLRTCPPPPAGLPTPSLGDAGTPAGRALSPRGRCEASRPPAHLSSPGALLLDDRPPRAGGLPQRPALPAHRRFTVRRRSPLRAAAHRSSARRGATATA